MTCLLILMTWVNIKVAVRAGAGTRSNRTEMRTPFETVFCRDIYMWQEGSLHQGMLK